MQNSILLKRICILYDLYGLLLKYKNKSIKIWFVIHCFCYFAADYELKVTKTQFLCQKT